MKTITVKSRQPYCNSCNSYRIYSTVPLGCKYCTIIQYTIVLVITMNIFNSYGNIRKVITIRMTTLEMTMILKKEAETANKNFQQGGYKHNYFNLRINQTKS